MDVASWTEKLNEDVGFKVRPATTGHIQVFCNQDGNGGSAQIKASKKNSETNC